jgi:hypothetical protein
MLRGREEKPMTKNDDNPNQNDLFQQAYDENVRQLNDAITALANAPHSLGVQDAQQKLRDLKVTMQKQHDRILQAA